MATYRSNNAPLQDFLNFIFLLSIVRQNVCLTHQGFSLNFFKSTIKKAIFQIAPSVEAIKNNFINSSAAPAFFRGYSDMK